MGAIHTCGPNRCMVVSGGCGSRNQTRYIVGGWAWSWQGLTDVQYMSLNLITTFPRCEQVETRFGVPVSVSCVAQCKVLRDSVAVAARHFLGKTDAEIGLAMQRTLEGHVRSILAQLTVEQAYRDRVTMAQVVRETAVPDLRNMGIGIMSFTIRDIQDDDQYLQSLGKAQIAQIKRNATISEAQCERDAQVKEAENERLTNTVVCSANANIENSSRQFMMHKSHYDQQVSSAQAEAELAYELQTSKIYQQLRTEQMQIDVVERVKGIELEEREVLKMEKELKSNVEMPADAEGYKVQKIAEGEREKALKTSLADGDCIKFRGEAVAIVTEKVGKAKALEMKLKSDVYKKYSKSAIIQQVLTSFPKIAAEISAPLSKVEEITLIGNDENGEDITDEILTKLENAPDILDVTEDAIIKLLGLETEVQA
ncbi:hypothetical protein LSTR_LSTR010270 [Laodelphax striatellus]|uniref:Band 7 domain-containing protein n=1 Tax=Laodelphax striatellus TaxID=195883 RepID=A0A482XRX0_LAOST|nr:hypothetical protein LSTR_LSTR010270 [Laodelphax striatellus]